MSLRLKNNDNRLESLRQSLDDSGSGGCTLNLPKWWANAPGHQPARCKIIGYYRTFLFEFPLANLVEATDHKIVYRGSGIKAVIVSNLPDYFESDSVCPSHYSIDTSLRASVQNTYAKALEKANRQTERTFPLFLVIEENRTFPPTGLNNGECFSMPEYQDGQVMIEGGRKGERALIAVKTIDGSWPKFKNDMDRVNTVLAAVKVVQKTIDPIKELYRHCCFVSDEGQPVYPLVPTMKAPKVLSVPKIKNSDILDKAKRIETMLQGMTRESSSNILELFDSIVLDDSEDDSFLRLWYLRLWQALDDMKGYLGVPQLWNSDSVIAGKHTPRELNHYRNKIAHWHTGRIDHQFLNDLQCTAMELMRRKFQRN